MIHEIVTGLDAQLGDVIENAATRHHVKRLARIRWDRALRGDGDAWAKAPPPRDGNTLQVHVDGMSALPAIAAAVRGARSYVLV